MTLPTSDTLPVLLRAALDRTLTPSEQLRWVGRPGPGRAEDDMGVWVGSIFGWMWMVVWAVPFTALMTGLAIRDAGKPDSDSPVVTFLGCSVFIVMAVCLIRMPARRRKRRANTVYAVTDRRAVIIETWWAGWWSWWRTPSVQSFGPADLGKLRRVDHPADRGDVVLAERVDSDGHVELDAFWNVADASDVEAVVRELVARPEPATVQQPHE